jgi:hypothetical protein
VDDIIGGQATALTSLEALSVRRRHIEGRIPAMVAGGASTEPTTGPRPDGYPGPTADPKALQARLEKQGRERKVR